jgi:hypothetical protein
MGIYFGNLTINGGVGSGNATGSLPYLTKVTLTASSWVDNQQMVTIKGILSDETQQVIEITPVFNESIMDEIANCNIYASSQGNNSITFFCDTAPTIDVEFYVKWQDITWVEDPTSTTINPSVMSVEGVEF